MTLHPRILAGTAIGLFMASTPLAAFPLSPQQDLTPRASSQPLMLAQAECAEGDEDCAQRQRRRPGRDRAAPEGESAPAERAPERRSAPEPQAEPAPDPERRQREAAPEPEAAPERAPQRRQRERAAEPQEAAPEAAPAEESRPRRERNREGAREERRQAPQPQAEEPQAEQPRARERQREQRRREEPAAETPAETPAEQPAPRPRPAPEPEAPAERETRQPAEPSAEEPAAERPSRREREQRGERREPAQQQEQAPEGERQRQPAGQEQPAEPGGQPAEGEAANPDEAPILDSEKGRRGQAEGRRPGREGRQPDAEGRQPAPEGERPDRAQERQAPERRQPVEAGPPPTDDRTAQEAIVPEKIVPIIEEKGTRRERAPDERRRERPSGVDVLREIGDRVILQLGGQTIVESNERPRMSRDARDVYYEDLPRGRTREVIVRDNGSQIVTIRNRNGDIIQRSRITPDGREYVLNYVDERYYDDVREWRDPGEDLPPIHLTIPREDYILESRQVSDPDVYYEFLEQPPVERVQRLYSVDEVKRSARVRDIARRIDLDTLNFEFGSASIGDSEIDKLDGVATAMEKMLEKNPGETFLIEGHTDAVGSDEANLALSDRRAEAVAEALTGAFGIPPENLTTQGYGEEYLKIDTQGPERENRRVTIRRITPLVAPVASAN